MQPLFEHRLELAGFRTRALELEGSGPALLLLHGYADSADTWRRVLALLARHDRAALAVDLPGFGAAARLRPGPVLPQLDAFAAAAVAHMADEHGDVVVAGNSLGGCVALRLGERDDLPLAGLVPIAPAGLDMARWFGLIERDPVLRSLLGLPVPAPEAVVRRLVGETYRRLAFARPGAMAAEVVAGFTAHHRDRRAVSAVLEMGRRLLPELASPFRLERVTCPVLLVWGDRDRMVSPDGARRVLAALPHAAYEPLPGCGHCPQVEQAPRIAELLMGFAPARRPVLD
jgi:pimeloyl-ACP methyl ester carboxylesterase